MYPRILIYPHQMAIIEGVLHTIYPFSDRPRESHEFHIDSNCPAMALQRPANTQNKDKLVARISQEPKKNELLWQADEPTPSQQRQVVYYWPRKQSP